MVQNANNNMMNDLSDNNRIIKQHSATQNIKHTNDANMILTTGSSSGNLISNNSGRKS